MEQSVIFPCGNLTLEGRFDHAPGQSAVVITHPHPLMGGDMSNPVVDTIRKAYRDKGYSTLRFNFRGAGRSTGEHGDGYDEINDVLAARDFLIDRGLTRIDLAGYSFGAWVNMMAATPGHGFKRLVLVSPPVDFIEFENMSDIQGLDLVLAGENDTYGTPRHIQKLLINWNKNAILVEIPDADHFYSHELGLLQEALSKHL